jgi:hypothetical protein
MIMRTKKRLFEESLLEKIEFKIKETVAQLTPPQHIYMYISEIA